MIFPSVYFISHTQSWSAMAETETQKHDEPHHEEDVHDANYQAPPEKTIEEIMAADQEDESLRRYKEALLGAAQAEKIIVG